MSSGFQMQPKGGRARLRARPPFRYAFYTQNRQKCLRGGFFEGFRGPREGFLRVFQNFRGRRRVFLGFFEGFLLALEKIPKIYRGFLLKMLRATLLNQLFLFDLCFFVGIGMPLPRSCREFCFFKDFLFFKFFPTRFFLIFCSGGCHGFDFFIKFGSFSI